MSELTGKELAIKTAEKLGEEGASIMIKQGCMHQSYIKEKASEILFSDGMAGKINEHVGNGMNENDEWTDTFTREWWSTLTPEKILNVWLSLDDKGLELE